MKKQFLYETHNLQDKAKKPEYKEQLQEEGDNFNRGGTSQKITLRSLFRGSALIIDLRPSLNDDKQSLLQTLDHHLKFIVRGNVGTISQLMQNPKLADHVRECHEMTRRSLLRADTFYIAQHPKKNRLTRVFEFDCFLQPAEPFQNPIPKHHFAFLLNVVTRPS